MLRHRLMRSDWHTLIWVGIGVLVSAASIAILAGREITPNLQHIVEATCPHWTEC